MSIDSKVAILCITENGQKLGLKIQEVLDDGHIYYIKNNEKRYEENNISGNTVESEIKTSVKIINSKVKAFVGEIFDKYDYIIFIMATGIVVRSIADFISSKFSDPAILVLDEQGQNIISLLSGHMGGANEMTLHISKLINANPVITTATDVNKKSSLDMISKALNGYIDNFRYNVKEINSMLVNNKPVGLYIDGNYEIDTRGFEVLDNSISLYELFENSKSIFSKLHKIVLISNKKEFIPITEDINENKDKKYILKRVVEIDDKYNYNEDIHTVESKFVKLVPKDIVVGIGCRKNIDSIELKNAFIDFLSKNNIDIKSIKEIGSIEIKKHEKAIIDLGKYLGVPFKTISVKEICEVDHLFDKSSWVKENVGVYSVSEPVAYILSNKNLIIQKQKYRGITFSVGRVKI